MTVGEDSEKVLQDTDDMRLKDSAAHHNVLAEGFL